MQPNDFGRRPRHRYGARGRGRINLKTPGAHLKELFQANPSPRTKVVLSRSAHNRNQQNAAARMQGAATALRRPCLYLRSLSQVFLVCWSVNVLCSRPPPMRSFERGRSAQAGFTAVQCDKLTGRERLGEIAAILALGLVRLRSRQSSETSAAASNSSLHSVCEESVCRARPHGEFR
jgi:hypothetical protein